MTRRIFFKLFFTFVGLFAIAGLGIDYLVKQVNEGVMRESLRASLRKEARLAVSILRGRPIETHPEVEQEIARITGARLTVIRPDGTVVVDSQADPEEMENHAGRPEFVEALAGRDGASHRVSRTVGEELLYVAVPYGDGALRLALPTSEIAARVEEIRGSILSVILLALIPTILLAAWLSRRISAKLSRIMEFSQRLAQGDFSLPIPRSGGGELGQLADSLGNTAKQLRAMIEEVRQERSRFEAAVNGIGEGILLVGRDRRIILSNSALNQMFPEQDLSVGAPLGRWNLPEIPQLFERVFLERQPHSVHLQITEPEERDWKVSCTPILGRAGWVQAAVAVFHDTTDLERLDRIRKDFVINVSHELRTPLAAVQGYAETLLDGAIDDPKHNRRFVQIISQNAERLSRLTADLMTLSQIEVNSREFIMEPHAVREMLSLAADSIRALTEKKNIQVAVAAAPGGETVECDGQAVQEILSNLLDNAVKYTPEGGRIEVGARRDGGAMEFWVSDTGIGIRSEHIPRLFERFYRVDKARSRALGGTGLGLAIVKHLVLAHHGTLRVKSKAGEGSTFYFRIPVRAERKPAPVDEKPEIAVGGS